MVRFSLYSLLSLLLFGCVAPTLNPSLPPAPDGVAAPTVAAIAVSPTPSTTAADVPGPPPTGTAEPTPSQPPTTPSIPAYPEPEPGFPPVAYPPPAAGSGHTIAQLESPDSNRTATLWYNQFPDTQEALFFITEHATNEVTVLERVTAPEDHWWTAKVPYPLEWSTDSQTLFYTYHPAYLDGCMSQIDSTLHRYDVATEQHALLNEREGGEITLSPDRQRAINFPYQFGEGAPTIGVYELVTDTFRETPVAAPDTTGLPYSNLSGLILWHEDNRRVLLSLYAGTCGGEQDRSALLILDTDTLTQTLVELEGAGEETGYQILGWQDDEWFTFARSDDGRLWRYNIETGALEGL